MSGAQVLAGTSLGRGAGVALREAALELASAVRRAAAPGRHGMPSVVRLKVEAPVVDPLDWLSAREAGTRMFWSARGEREAVAMTGAADRYEGSDDLDFDRLAAYVRHVLDEADPSVRFFGGLRFDPDRRPDELWEPFGSFRFTLPRFEYAVRGEGAELACNLVLPRDRRDVEALAAACAALDTVEPSAQDLPWRAVERRDDPDRETWVARVTEALGAIGEHALQKIVLARRTSFEFPEPLEPLEVLRRLREATPNRFHYCMEADRGRAFVGATPERLFRREGSVLFSEAVAGTRPRIDDAVADQELLAALLGSDKEQREHLSVRWAIEEILRPFCEALTVDGRASEMRLAHGRHLVSRFEGVLRPGISSWDLVRHLHPTPAVGGYPEQAALKAIRHAEAFDRGWYAGPIGCVGRDFAEFAVALRCGVTAGRTLHLFSGAGIVTGSEPDTEWDEIEHKIVDFARVVGLSPELPVRPARV